MIDSGDPGEDAEPTVKVLLVDDEAELANIYAEWLSEAYEVVVAFGGEDALDVFDESVDIVLLDRRMPDLSGDEVLSTIREQGHTTQVVMVTAVEPDFDIIELGFDGYLTKPVGAEDLHTVVERMLDRRDFDANHRTYAQLVAQRVALEAEKRPDELEASDEFADLVGRIEALEASFDEAMAEFDDEDFHAVFRDI